MAPSPILISIEGDIGAGKSTLVESLKKRHPEWNFIDEPVGTWQNLRTEKGTNLLELFYSDKDRWSYTFQNCAVLTRALNIQKTISDWKKRCEEDPSLEAKHVFVTERCLETDYHVFAKMMRDDGKLNPIEWDLYKMWYEYVSKTTQPVDGILYVNTPPQVCAERIRFRGRKGEDAIPLAYLENLERYHKAWLFDCANEIPVFRYKNVGTVTPAEEVDAFVKGLAA